MVRSRLLLAPFLASLALSVSACDDDLLDEQNGTESGGSGSGEGATGGPGQGPQDPKVQHEKMGEQWSSQIDASNREEWVYLDLDDRVYPSADEQKQGLWDLSFQRVKVRVNGGVSGTGPVQGLFVEGPQAFESLSVAPAGPYTTDAKSQIDPSEDIFQNDGKVFGLWYNYATQGHVVTPKDRSYVIKTDKNQYFKVKITDYYNAAKTSGHYSIVWAPIAAPAATF